MINDFTIQEVRSFWDKVARIYEPLNKTVGYVHTQRFEKTIEFSDIQPGMKILNIWSRTGNLIPYLRKLSYLEIYNREVSEEMIKIARHNYPNEEFKLTDLENLSEFENNYFDRIISLETLEHTPRPLAFLSEIKRILKPGGLLIMSIPPRGSELPEFFYNLFFKDHGEGPHRYLWPREVKEILKKAKLNLVSHRPFIILPFGNERFARRSEKWLTAVFGKTPLANFGYRHFYICKRGVK